MHDLLFCQKGGYKCEDSKRHLCRGWWTRWSLKVSSDPFCDSMIVCQKTNATAFYPTFRSEKDRARLQKSHHSGESFCHPESNTQRSKCTCFLESPEAKGKKKKKGKKKDVRLQDITLKGKFVKHFFYNWVLQLFSKKKQPVEMMTVAW